MKKNILYLKKKIAASSELGEFYDTWNVNTQNIWGLFVQAKCSLKKVTLVLFGQNWPTIGNEWKNSKNTKILQIFVCTIYKSATMHKQVHSNDGVKL